MRSCAYAPTVIAVTHSGLYAYGDVAYVVGTIYRTFVYYRRRLNYINSHTFSLFYKIS